MLLSALGEVIPTIASLFCYTKQNVSHLRSVKAWVIIILKYLVKLSELIVMFNRNPCQEILQWYLSNVERSSALLLLKHLCGVQGGGGGVAPGCHFSPGSEGGVRLTRKNPVRWWRCVIAMQYYVTELVSKISNNLFCLMYTAMRMILCMRKCQGISGKWSVL